MGHWSFLNSTGDRESIKRQRHVTLAFLKIDMRHQDLPSRAPITALENYIPTNFFKRGLMTIFLDRANAEISRKFRVMSYYKSNTASNVKDEKLILQHKLY